MHAHRAMREGPRCVACVRILVDEVITRLSVVPRVRIVASVPCMRVMFIVARAACDR